MSNISIHSLGLFNLTKAISSGCEVGVLLGTKNGDSYVVETTFELLCVAGEIDLSFYDKRLQQHLSVSPSLEKVGIYVIGSTLSLGGASIRYGSVLKSDIILVVSSDVNFVNSSQFITGYNKHVPMNTSIQSDEIEGISLSTISKYNKYFGDETQSELFSAHDSKLNIVTSINQLSIKLQSIIQYCDSDHTQLNTDKCIEANNLIGQLIKKLRVLKSKDFIGSNTDKLISNEFALLTEAYALLDRYKVQTNNGISLLNARNRPGP